MTTCSRTRPALLAASLLFASSPAVHATPTSGAGAAFTPLWAHSIGSGADDTVRGLARDSQGNVIVAGSVGGDFFGVPVGRGGYVQKLSESGKVLWTARVGTAQDDDLFGLTTDAAGNIYVAGRTAGEFLPGQSAGSDDAFVAKLTPAGKIVWVKQFGTPDDDDAHAVALGPDGSIYVMGQTRGTLPHNTAGGGLDTFVARLSGTGEVQWMQQFGDEYNEYATGVAADGSGHVYIAGTTVTDRLGASNGFVIQLGVDGHPTWAKQYGTRGQTSVNALAVRGNTVALVGDTTGTLPGAQASGDGSDLDAFVMDVSADGAMRWIRQFGSADRDGALGVSLAADDTVTVTGYVSGPVFDQKTQGEDDVFVSQYSAKGERRWTRTFGTPRSDLGYMVLTANDDLFVAGTSDGPITGKPVAGAGDAFVVRLPLKASPAH
ncbi:SBBP repeat-containing protein [Deinococcus ruber]|uniref:Beta-propeller repeat protein n=1 Tax=Deinococcus ruber TaxID=1848197 RepID=A0A918CEY0_9DEIO|nr:SBBP repeat-containing protein [Deinococcus ruber]GGR19372.1 hypothetical protein GCM10008957_34850 [Deinococcus ruber]